MHHFCFKRLPNWLAYVSKGKGGKVMPDELVTNVQRNVASGGIGDVVDLVTQYVPHVTHSSVTHVAELVA